MSVYCSNFKTSGKQSFKLLKIIWPKTSWNYQNENFAPSKKEKQSNNTVVLISDGCLCSLALVTKHFAISSLAPVFTTSLIGLGLGLRTCWSVWCWGHVFSYLTLTAAPVNSQSAALCLPTLFLAPFLFSFFLSPIDGFTAFGSDGEFDACRKTVVANEFNPLQRYRTAQLLFRSTFIKKTMMWLRN